MKKIWYLLTCPKGNEADYAEKCRRLLNSKELEEVACFQYERMIRYGGKWHLEERMAMPGHIFLSGTSETVLKRSLQGNLIPCETPYLKDMCQEGNLVGISKGVIRHGSPVVTSGPLKGRERLIRKIDRHKRTAEIEIPFAGQKKQVTVGLEIYEKG